MQIHVHKCISPHLSNGAKKMIYEAQCSFTSLQFYSFACVFCLLYWQLLILPSIQTNETIGMTVDAWCL